MAMSPRNDSLVSFSLVALLLFSLLGLLLSGCNNDSPVKIGLSINLSGYNGAPGEDIRDGTLLAVREINQNPSFRKLKLIIKDDANNPRGIKDADTSLIEAGCPVIIGHSYSQNTLTAYPIVTGAGRILITAYTATTLLSKKDDLFFRTSVDNFLYSQAFAKLFKTRHIKNIMLVLDKCNPSFSRDLSQRIQHNFSGTCYKIELNTKEWVDWNGLVTQILDANPQAVLMITEAKGTAILSQKLRGKGYKGHFFATIWAQDPKLIDLGAQAVEGLELVSFIKPHYKNRLYRHFAKAMQEEFHKPASAKAARAYELVYILADAINRCGANANDPECLKKRLLEGRYNLLLGKVRFDRFGDVKRSIYCISIRNGSFHFDHVIL